MKLMLKKSLDSEQSCFIENNVTTCLESDANESDNNQDSIATHAEEKIQSAADTNQSIAEIENATENLIESD